MSTGPVAGFEAGERPAADASHTAALHNETSPNFCTRIAPMNLTGSWAELLLDSSERFFGKIDHGKLF